MNQNERCKVCGKAMISGERLLMPSADIIAGCPNCGAVKLEVAENRSRYCVRWCRCGAIDLDDQRYYFCEDGTHGWYHKECKGITQTG